MSNKARSFNEPLSRRLVRSSLADLASLVRRAIGLPNANLDAYDLRRLAHIDISLLQEIAYAIRGANYRPAIIVHGVMPRSGTNFIADLLKLHESIAPYPHRLWEFPLLHNTESICAAQINFLRTYKRNAEIIEDFELVAYLASGFLRYLQHLAGPDKTVLLKVPHAEFVYLFHAIFPRDHCILVLRDGRDAVASHVNTFRPGPFKPGFSELCEKWSLATNAVLQYPKSQPRSAGRALLVRYEDANADPRATVKNLLRSCDLATASYDFRQASDLPVRGSSAIQDSGEVTWAPKEKPKDFRPVGRWHDWSDSRKRRFKRIAGETLVAAGYVSNDDW